MVEASAASRQLLPPSPEALEEWASQDGRLDDVAELYAAYTSKGINGGKFILDEPHDVPSI